MVSWPLDACSRAGVKKKSAGHLRPEIVAGQAVLGYLG